MLSLSASGLGKPDLANYVPNQRLEWKRYKQYTRNDIMAAIEEVKSGMNFFFSFYFTKTFYAQSISFENDRFSLGKQKMKKNPGSTRIKPIFSSINHHYFFRNVGVASISQIWRAIQNSVRQSQKDGYHYGTASTEKIFAELSFAISRA